MKNLLLVVVDCLRADRLAGVGDAHIPTLERVRDGGTWFTQAIAGASNTTPSFSTLLTGRYPFVHGVRQLRSKLGSDVRVLPEILAGEGYRTIGRVTGPLFEESGLGRGFHDYEWRSPDDYLRSRWGKELRKQIGSFEQPWFLLLHLWELHWPRQAPMSYRLGRRGDTLYDQALSALDVQLDWLLDAIPDNTLVILTGDHGERLDTTHDRSDVLGIAAYAARPAWHWLRRRAPISIGGALDDLRRSAGLPDELHGRRAGFGLNDYLIRIPLVFWGSGVKSGHVTSQVRQVDVTPSILQLLGLSAQPDLDLPLFPVETLDEHDRLAYAEATDDHLGWIACVRDARFKYVCRPDDRDDRGMLFDLVSDPLEEHDVAQSRPTEAGKYRDALLRLMTTAGPPRSPEPARTFEEDERVLGRLADLGYLEDR